MPFVVPSEALSSSRLTAILHDAITSHAVAIAERAGVTIEVPFRCNPAEAVENLTDMLLEYEKFSGEVHPVDKVLGFLRDSVEIRYVGDEPS